MQRHGYNAAPLHGDLDQSFRMQTLARFKSGEVKLLVASDVAARGLDIPDVSHVFNYEPPRHADDFVHRVGRTGRAGRSGEAYTLIAPIDRKSLAAIEKLIGKTLEEATIEGVPTAPMGDNHDQGGWGREREERRSRRGRGGKPREERAEPKAEEPKTEEKRAERSRQDRPRDERPREDRPREDRPRNDRPREERPRREDRDNGPDLVGFGGDTPAFLRKP